MNTWPMWGQVAVGDIIATVVVALLAGFAFWLKDAKRRRKFRSAKAKRDELNRLRDIAERKTSIEPGQRFVTRTRPGWTHEAVVEVVRADHVRVHYKLLNVEKPKDYDVPELGELPLEAFKDYYKRESLENVDI